MTFALLALLFELQKGKENNSFDTWIEPTKNILKYVLAQIGLIISKDRYELLNYLVSVNTVDFNI